MFDPKIGETVNAADAEVETDKPKDSAAKTVALQAQVNRVDFIFCRGCAATGSCVGESDTH